MEANTEAEFIANNPGIPEDVLRSIWESMRPQPIISKDEQITKQVLDSFDEMARRFGKDYNIPILPGKK